MLLEKASEDWVNKAQKEPISYLKQRTLDQSQTLLVFKENSEKNVKSTIQWFDDLYSSYENSRFLRKMSNLQYSIQWFGDQIDSKIGSPGQSEMNHWWDYGRGTQFSWFICSRNHFLCPAWNATILK